MPVRQPQRHRSYLVLFLFTLTVAVSPAFAQPPVTDESPGATESPSSQAEESIEKEHAGEDASTNDKEESSESGKTEENPEAETESPAEATKAEHVETVKARFQAHVPSLHRLTTELRNSLAGRIATEINTAIEDAKEIDEDDTDPQRLHDVLTAVESWPNAECTVAFFTPDVEGKLRWAVQIGLPVGQVHDLIADLKNEESTGEFLEPLTETVTDGEFVYRVGANTLAYLKAVDTGQCLLRSHDSIEFPAKIFKGTKGDNELVLATRLELKKTEKDSSSTFLSNFSLVTAVDYTARIDDGGVWHDQLRVAWPIVSGLTMKAMIGSPKQTFFVPSDAFMGAVFNIGPTKQLLENSAGMESAPGPISRHAGDEMLVTILPGDGFMPVPEIVAQCRTSKADKLIEALRQEINSLNAKAVREERAPEWHETEVDDHTVFWCDSRGKTGTSLVPFQMRPVLFVQQAKDARSRERDFLIAGWTSTNPKRFVKRWLERPRDDDSLQFLPAERGKNAEAWIHWKQVYAWAQPYINLGIRSFAAGPLLTDDLGADIPDASLTGELKLGGMIFDHQGPVPIGLLAVPALAAAGTNETSNTDMGRERAARRQLEVLYHHCKLFHKDTGRWPVRVAELDGYVDFAGNRQLLKLQDSSRRMFGKLLGQMFKVDKNKEEDDESKTDSEEDDLYDGIDDSIYVVSWHNDQWRLGFAEEQLEHLKQLYINESGTIHRELKTASSENSDEEQEDKGASHRPEKKS